MFTMHTLHAFGWIFLCHLEGCDSINFIDKKFLTLYCLITWNENHALMVTQYCRKSQSCSITQFNNSNPTTDNSTQITIVLGTYTYLHVCRLARLTQNPINFNLIRIPLEGVS